ncbi:MAG: DEAD/DEAH box helicase [Actinobacteria bacterium]|nr:DEAD/DEAH box helicase [Actinomycetota bacterium]
MDPCDLLDALRRDAELGDRIVHVEHLPAREARYAEPKEPVLPAIADGLARRGIDALYAHQAQALDLLRSGHHLVLATGTASGKSLCYQIPLVEAAVEGRTETALMLFPTKALAHDQLRSLRSWLVPQLEAVTYDGDTPQEERSALRGRARVVLTNPDMLHVGILPNHQRWATFLSRLTVVVVDELHSLRGIFGSHVAHVIRRLRRLCHHYGSDPVFCFSSATIGNPVELACALSGLEVALIDDDASPQSARCFGLWERPLVDAASGTRASANADTARLLARLTREGFQSLAFTRSRRGAEVVARISRGILEEDAPDLVPRVAAYRGGYLPEERRELEDRLATGDLVAVAATNALELGIDVGGLDAVTLNGFPGTLASMWQQVGRAGRSGRRSLAVLVTGDDQLDQWYAAHPGELFSRPPEPAVINPHNRFVALPHLGCAAFELPLTDADADYFGDDLDEHVAELVRDGVLRLRNGRCFWGGRRPPASAVSLRSGGGGEFRLVDSDTHDLVGTVDGSRVFQVAHEGALYLHQGRQYRVVHLALADRLARLEPSDDDEYTQTREDIDLTIVSTDARRSIGPARVHLGRVTVTTTVTGYQRKEVGTGDVIEIVDLDLPPRTLDTRAVWYAIPEATVDELGLVAGTLIGSLHAAEHGLIGMLPLFAICDRWDVGGLSIALHPDTGEATIFVYDGYPGGAGIADLGFERAEQHVTATRDLIAACPCDGGCPSCVQSPKCGNWNEYLDKEAAVRLLTTLAPG